MTPADKAAEYAAYQHQHADAVRQVIQWGILIHLGAVGHARNPEEDVDTLDACIRSLDNVRDMLADMRQAADRRRSWQ